MKWWACNPTASLLSSRRGERETGGCQCQREGKMGKREHAAPKVCKGRRREQGRLRKETLGQSRAGKGTRQAELLATDSMCCGLELARGP